MSTSYTELIQNLTRQDEARDREEMSRDSEPAPQSHYSGAALALLGNAGVVDYEATPLAHPSFSPGFNMDDLPRVLAYGLQAAHVFLNLFEKPCPGECRDFALAMMALSKAGGTEFEAIPDERIAKLINRQRDTVRKKREMFFDWQDKNDLGLIDFRAQEYNPAAKQYDPNTYRVNLVGYVADFVDLARSGLRGNPRYLIENAVETGLKEHHDAVCSAIPNAEIVKRAKERRQRDAPARQTRTAAAKGKEDRIVGLFDEWCGEHKEDLHTALELLYARLDAVAKKHMGYED